ncbi:hypothetical protein JCM8547_001180 [Rhodosporidiobolus lusitaniae]
MFASPLTLAALVVLLAALAIIKYVSRSSHQAQEKAVSAPPIGKTALWPLPKSAILHDYTVEDLEKTTPLPFRPFRWGPVYPQTMLIRMKESAENWLLLDKHTTSVATATLPGYHDHALEALREICSFLSTRFPRLFTVERLPYIPHDSTTHGDSVVGKEAGAICKIENKITGDIFDFRRIEAEEGPEWNPIKIAGLLLMDDIVILVEGDDGQYRFQAGSNCTPGFWRFPDMIGKTLDEIHYSGQVPNYEERYRKPMNKFFHNLKEDKLVERNNYFFQVDNGLDWSLKTNGSEHVFDGETKLPNPEWVAESKEPVVFSSPATDISEIYFRTERQIMRRLPRSKAILFIVRTFLIPVTELAEEPGVPGRLASAIRSWPLDERGVAWYKGLESYSRVLLPFLDKKHEEQLEKGIVHLNEKGQTEENYPW